MLPLDLMTSLVKVIWLDGHTCILGPWLKAVIHDQAMQYETLGRLISSVRIQQHQDELIQTEQYKCKKIRHLFVYNTRGVSTFHGAKKQTNAEEVFRSTVSRGRGFAKDQRREISSRRDPLPLPCKSVCKNARKSATGAPYYVLGEPFLYRLSSLPYCSFSFRNFTSLQNSFIV